MSFMLDNKGSEVQTAINNSLELFKLIYPVGSIYMSVNSTSPATLFGGTWTQIKDTFLLAAGDSYTAGNTGGEATHILTTGEMPGHTHETSILYNETGYGNSSKTWEFYIDDLAKISNAGFATTNSTANTLTNVNTRKLRSTSSTGSSVAHNNMPPYLAVYMWRRIT